MKNRIVSSTLSSTVQWHWDAGREYFVRGVEKSRVWTLDGGHFQETFDAGPDDVALPKRFEDVCCLWRRFLKRFRIPEFQLRLDRRRIRVWEPGPTSITLLPKWTFTAKIPALTDSGTLVSQTFRALAPPSGRMISDLKTLLDAPMLKPQSADPSPILIRGDLLIGFLADALDHLVTRSGEHGSWRQRFLPGLNTASFPDESVNPEPKPFFGRYRFVPGEVHDLSAATWRAIVYGADRHVMLCTRGRGSEREYKAITLDQPLYRLFRLMKFDRRIFRAVVKGVDYEIPSAIFYPNLRHGEG